MKNIIKNYKKFEIEKSLKETQELYESLLKEYFKGEINE